MKTQQEIKDKFTYLHGHLYFNTTGKKAGHVNTSGYVEIKWGYQKFKAHRLIWAYFHGEVPKLLDHVNRNRADNRIENLRPATPVQNSANTTTIPSRNRSGVRGVYWLKDCRRWQAKLIYEKKEHIIGYYLTIEEAESAYLEYAKTLHGEFFPKVSPRVK